VRLNHSTRIYFSDDWGRTVQFSVRIMTKSDEFYLRALECSRLAKATANLEDKQAWLKLAEDWGKLARSEDLLDEHWKDLQAKRSIGFGSAGLVSVGTGGVR
jgi:hypothetical protein